MGAFYRYLYHRGEIHKVEIINPLIHLVCLFMLNWMISGILKWLKKASGLRFFFWWWHFVCVGICFLFVCFVQTEGKGGYMLICSVFNQRHYLFIKNIILLISFPCTVAMSSAQSSGITWPTTKSAFTVFSLETQKNSYFYTTLQNTFSKIFWEKIREWLK